MINFKGLIGKVKINELKNCRLLLLFNVILLDITITIKFVRLFFPKMVTLQHKTSRLSRFQGYNDGYGYNEQILTVSYRVRYITDLQKYIYILSRNLAEK